VATANLLQITSRRCDSFVAVLEAVRDLADHEPPDYLLGRKPSELFVQPSLAEPGKFNSYPWRELDHPKSAPIVINGREKAGKSLLLKMIAHDLAVDSLNQLNRGAKLADDIDLPIYIDLARASNPENELLKDKALSSIEALLSSSGIGGAMKEPVTQCVADRFEQRNFSRFVFLFDNVTTSQLRDQMTRSFTETWPKVFMTSHPDSSAIPDEWPRYEIVLFKAPQILEFLGKWRGAKYGIEEERKNGDFNSLMRNPYLLTLACKAATDRREPDFKTVYDEAEKLGLWKRPLPPRPLEPQPRHKRGPTVWKRLILGAATVVCLALGAYFFAYPRLLKSGNENEVSVHPRPLKSGDVSEVEKAIKTAQKDNVRVSWGTRAGECFTDMDYQKFKTEQVPLKIAQSLRSDRAFLEGVLALREKPAAEREKFIQSCRRSLHLTWAELGHIGPDGQTDAGQAAELDIANAVADMIEELVKLPEEKNDEIFQKSLQKS
jgi:hypothetical protein